MPNNQTTPCLKSLSERKDVKKFVILIHGFLNSFATQWLHDMQADLQAVDPGTAVMVIFITHLLWVLYLKSHLWLLFGFHFRLLVGAEG